MLRSVCALVLALLLCALGSAPVTGDMSISELRQLYRRRVLVAEKFVRLKEGVPDWMPTVYVNSHSGVRVTLEGTPIKYLIHKGPKNSDSSYKTIITEARHMNSKWQLRDTKYYKGRVTVQDLMNAAGGTYTWWDANCHKAARDMMNL
ncbi:hypothetical protein WMY93_030541 [Mugilogobius chulae]|uniref:Uncharacterized protein n=1 Tax=Mugilogobius chulae TaxID=88201 RepID=A0AAW0MKW0_9GOBI